MADRLLMEAGKLVVSKEGEDASDPLLTPGEMLFNSDWLFSGTIIAAGVHVDAASYAFAGYHDANGYTARESTSDTYTQVINFPPQPYVPTVMLIPLGDSRHWNYYGMLLWGPNARLFVPPDTRLGDITVSNSQITIPRVRPTNTSVRMREDFIYIVMGM